MRYDPSNNDNGGIDMSYSTANAMVDIVAAPKTALDWVRAHPKTAWWADPYAGLMSSSGTRPETYWGTWR
jgi:hypothetical protein